MKTTEKTDHSMSLKILKFIRMGLVLLLGGIVLNNVQAASQRSQQEKSISSVTPSTVINTQTSQSPAPNPQTKVQSKKAIQPTQSPTSDYVKCNISAKCGGGYKEMLKTTCEEMVCCTYSLDYPPIFTSRSDCEARVKQYEKPFLSPDWGNQSGYTYPSSIPSTNSDNEVLRQKLITECKAHAQRTMYDTISLCPTYGGVQDSTCVAQAQQTGAQVSANCDNIK